MRVLALETTGLGGSAALLDGDQPFAMAAIPEPQRSAQGLAPVIESLCRDAHWIIDQVELIAVASGPGSFTGLRVGLTMAKTLAYALQVPVLGVDTLEVLATQAGMNAGDLPIHAVFDAQRNELFAATYRATASREIALVDAARIVSSDDWLRQLRSGEIVVGPILERIESRLPNDVIVAPTEQWHPQAVTIGQIAFRQFERGLRQDLWSLTPTYLRASAAEEKLQQRSLSN